MSGSWVGRHWFEDLQLLPDSERGSLPATVAHDYVAGHRVGCPCSACSDYRRHDPELLARLRRDRLRSGAPARR